MQWCLAKLAVLAEEDDLIICFACSGVVMLAAQVTYVCCE